MLKRSIIVLLALTLITVSGIRVMAQDGLIQVTQWADEAEASSQYGDDDWSADQATGRPDVDQCADSIEAWASETYDGEETLTLTFDDEVIPTQVNIYQNLTPGAIVGIEIIPDDNDDDPVFFEIQDPSDECPSVLSIDLPDDLPETQQIIIHFDMALVGYWNEIDAVELVGLVEGDEDDADETSIESGRYDEYFVFSVAAEDASSSGNSGKGDDDEDDNSASSDFDGDWGRDVSCAGGGEITNGVELTIVQQRAGNQYRVTAIGLDGFDPVLAVMLTGNYNDALCNDDDSEAATYSANLPTTGSVSSAGTSSQVIFNLTSNNAFEDVSIVVGGFGESSGEYLLIIEGMYASSADGAGDPMALSLSPALIESGVDATTYMISVVSSFDPLLFLADDSNVALVDGDGVSILCDDAGDARLCWGNSSSLVGSYVSRSANRQLGGGQFDSMMSLALTDDLAGFVFRYVMTSYGSSEGDYVVAFHLGIEAED